jgi:hypothetical protein
MSNEIAHLFTIEAEARRLERARCLAAVDAEPEFEGDMPDAVWVELSSDRAAATEILRWIVRRTKADIRAHIVLS